MESVPETARFRPSKVSVVEAVSKRLLRFTQKVLEAGEPGGDLIAA